MTEPRFEAATVDIIVTCPKCAHSHSITLSEDELPGSASERFFKLAEVQKMLNVSRRTVKRWIYDGKLKAVKPTGNAQSSPWFVPESALKEFRRKYGR